jgi:hypothetical protein
MPVCLEQEREHFEPAEQDNQGWALAMQYGIPK